MVMRSIEMQRNALSDATSPYLRQHAENPVWWQEWSEETLQVARETGTPLFVSVGYATCHWCHVMAAEAFSSEAVANALNEHFIAVKVDREERPDIDHYLMSFQMASQGRGGWPLNVFLTPAGRPFAALTYLPVTARDGMPGFLDVIGRVREFLREKADSVSEFDLWAAAESTLRSEDSPPGDDRKPAAHQTDELIAGITTQFDESFAGFGTGSKFPPHNTLVFLLHAGSIAASKRADEIVQRTLNAMAAGGLHDHLGGGFFRYCVDRAWAVPHFEKMLYDQAMALWVYAEAFGRFGNEWYGQIADGIITCLERDFADERGLFASAFDADTDHREGATYLWSREELEAIDGEWTASFFEIDSQSVVEGRHHLRRKRPGPLADADRRTLAAMLERRRLRPQPDVDGKIVTAWNALAGVAFVVAGRRLSQQKLIDRSVSLYAALQGANRLEDGSWARSTFESAANPVSFLEDEAAVLLLLTYLLEEARTPDTIESMEADLESARERVLSFRTDGIWMAARTRDFRSVPADRFDSPSPASASLAEVALQRSALLANDIGDSIVRGRAIEHDFYNLAWLMDSGEFYVVERPDPVPWNTLPINALQRQASHETYCYRRVCYSGLPDTWNPGANA